MPPRRGGICRRLTQDLPSTWRYGEMKEHLRLMDLVGAAPDVHLTALLLRPLDLFPVYGSGFALREIPQRHTRSYKNKHFTEMCCGTEAGSYLRLIDSCITQLEAQGPCRTCNESLRRRRRSRRRRRRSSKGTEGRTGGAANEWRNGCGNTPQVMHLIRHQPWLHPTRPSCAVRGLRLFGVGSLGLRV